MQMQLFEGETINVSSKSKAELVQAYGVCRHTLRTWLLKVPGLDTKKKRIFTPIEVSIIYKHLGTP
jgi:hypothetical protein